MVQNVLRSLGFPYLNSTELNRKNKQWAQKMFCRTESPNQWNRASNRLLAYRNYQLSPLVSSQPLIQPMHPLIEVDLLSNSPPQDFLDQFGRIPINCLINVRGIHVFPPMFIETIFKLCAPWHSLKSAIFFFRDFTTSTMRPKPLTVTNQCNSSMKKNMINQRNIPKPLEVLLKDMVDTSSFRTSH